MLEGAAHTEKQVHFTHTSEYIQTWLSEYTKHFCWFPDVLFIFNLKKSLTFLKNTPTNFLAESKIVKLLSYLYAKLQVIATLRLAQLCSTTRCREKTKQGQVFLKVKKPS